MNKKWILKVYWSSNPSIYTTFKFKIFKQVAYLIEATHKVEETTNTTIVARYKLSYSEVI